MSFSGESSNWAKVGFLLNILALGSHGAGYGTNHWMASQNTDVVIGLWKQTDCSGSNGASCKDSAFPESYENTNVTVTRAMESCTLALLFVTTVCLLLYVCLKKARTRPMAIAMLIMGFLAVACNIAGIVVWLINMPTDHYASWSFGLTVCGAMLAIIAAILVIPDIREYDYKGLLEVDEESKHLSAIEEKERHPSPSKLYMYNDLDRIFSPQTPMTPPTFQGLKYDRRTGRAGSPAIKQVADSTPVRERKIVNTPSGLSVYILGDRRTCSVSPTFSVKYM